MTFFVMYFSQKSVADSLEQRFKISKSNDEKATLQMELSDYWSYRDTAKAFQHLKIADQFVGNNDFLKGVALFYKGGIYFDINSDKAQNLYKQADEKLKNIATPKSYEFRAKLWHNYAVLQQMKDNNQDFLNITLKKCIPFGEKSGNKKLLSGYYVDVGLIFNNYREFPKAILYFNKALETLKDVDNKDEAAAWVYLNLAGTHLETNDLKAVNSALKNVDIYLAKSPESQYNVIAYQQKSRYYNAIGNTNEAFITIQKGIAFAKTMNLDYDYFTLSYEYYRFLKKDKKYDEAKSVLQNLLNENKYSQRKLNKLVILNELSGLEKELGDFKAALSYSEQFQMLNDTVQRDNEKLQVLNLETEFKTKEQQKSLQHLQSKNKQQKIISIISAILLFVVISFFIYALKQRKKANEQKLLTIQQQQKNEVEQALYEGEIHERERIAKDLHDGIGGRITGIKIHLENLAQQHKSSDLQNLTNQLEICLSELRNTARNLTPETLKKFGLEEAIKDFCQNMSSSATSISCYVKNLNQIRDQKTQIHIFHIIQETVNNAMKHSEASKILVQCTYEDHVLLLDIEDNGKGFESDKISRGLGLNNIEKRVHAFNGKLNIQTAPNSGTTVNIEAKI